MLLFDGRNEVRKRFLTSPWALGSLCSDADAASAEHSPIDAGNPIPIGDARVCRSSRRSRPQPWDQATIFGWLLKRLLELLFLFLREQPRHALIVVALVV